MKPPRIAALIYGNNSHYLDHLAPLSSLLQVPLLVTELKIESLAKKYYPNLMVSYHSPVEIGEIGVQNFEVIISSLPKKLFDPIFFLARALHGKELINVWSPHGNSDKGHTSYFMEELAEEKWACVYGEQMVNFMKEKGVFDQLEDHFYLGNYRYKYFLKHKTFYQGIMKKFPKGKKTLLYAPTWDDCENNSSFSSSISTLLDVVPTHWNLIIKPHPNTSHNIRTTKDNVLILDDFPPIYPLLDPVDAYLGDMSSIGYDSLIFNKPLFFLAGKKDLPLFECGTNIPPTDLKNVFSIIERTDPTSFIKKQQILYDQVFAQKESIEKIYELSRPCPL